jgi:chromosome segregation ATPase
VKSIWRETFCNALKHDNVSEPLVDKIVDILRENRLQKEDWDESYIINLWLSSDFIARVRTVKTFRDLIFTPDNQLDETSKNGVKQVRNYRNLHSRSVLFLGELSEAYNKEMDIVAVLQPVNTIQECRKLSEDILRNQRRICQRVYKKLFAEEKKAPTSVTSAVVEDADESEEEEGEEGEESLENLRAELALSQGEVERLSAQLTLSQGEVTALRDELDKVKDDLKWSREEVTELLDENFDLTDKIEFLENPPYQSTCAATLQRELREKSLKAIVATAADESTTVLTKGRKSDKKAEDSATEPTKSRKRGKYSLS